MTRVQIPSEPENIFILFCVGVQTFMAYNGGATSGSVDDIERVGNWGPAHLGALGAMDKIGMTLSSAFWGYALQIFPAKTLLIVGLFVNALSTLLFGVLSDHFAMFVVKLLIGFTEGLQWVWAPLWINRWAGAGQLEKWMLISGGVVAGVGSGLGIVIAGFGTANGFTYAFAFKMEATVLFLLWLAMLPIGRTSMSIKTDICREHTLTQVLTLTKNWSDLDNADSVCSGERGSRLDIFFSTCRRWMDDFKGRGMFRKAVRHSSIREQFADCRRSPVFFWAALSLAMVNFVTSGMQFTWIRIFTGVWGLSKNEAVLSFLVVMACGSVIGILVGGQVQYTPDAEGNHYIALWSGRAHLISFSGALLAMMGMLWRLYQLAGYGTYALSLTWLGMLIVFAGLNATPGLLQILCLSTFDDEQARSFGTGIYQLLVNFVGLAMGPFLPQLAMSIYASVPFSSPYPYRPQQTDEDSPWALFVSFMCLLLGTLGGVIFTSLTASGSKYLLLRGP